MKLCFRGAPFPPDLSLKSISQFDMGKGWDIDEHFSLWAS